MKIIRAAIRESQRPDFRIVEFNVLGNHLHLVVEAEGKRALARGLQGFEVRAARRVNSALKRCGKLFAQRYHARALKTPTEVRHALRYVMCNRKHHDAEKRFFRTWVDPCSSGPWFTGWADPIVARHARELAREPAPTVPAESWLLRVGWRERAGPLRFDEAPA